MGSSIGASGMMNKKKSTYFCSQQSQKKDKANELQWFLVKENLLSYHFRLTAERDLITSKTFAEHRTKRKPQSRVGRE